MYQRMLDMSKEECRGKLRSLELDSYSSVLSAFRAQGILCDTKMKILESLRHTLRITQDRHRAESRRVSNDEKLSTIANTLCGMNTCPEWMREGRRLCPLLPRNVPLTEYSKIANDVARIVEEGFEFPTSCTTFAQNINETNEAPIVPHINLIQDTQIMPNQSECEEAKLQPQPVKNNVVIEDVQVVVHPNSSIQSVYKGADKSSIIKKKSVMEKQLNRKKIESPPKFKINKKSSTFTNINSQLCSTDFDSLIKKTQCKTKNEAPQIATCKKDITTNVSKLNLKAQKQENINKKLIPVRIIPPPSHFKLSDKFGEGSSKMNLNRNEFIQQEDEMKAIDHSVDVSSLPKVCSIRKLNFKPDSHIICHNKPATVTSQDSIIINMLQPGYTPIPPVIAQNIGPMVVQNVQIQNASQNRGLKQPQVELVKSSNGQIYIEHPEMDYFNSGITPKNVATTINNDSQQFKTSQPKMVLVRRTFTDRVCFRHTDDTGHETDKSYFTEVVRDNGMKKNNEILLESAIQNESRPTFFTPMNTRNESNIITEDTPVDILSMSEFYVHNPPFKKQKYSGHLTPNNYNFTLQNQDDIEEIVDNDSTVLNNSVIESDVVIGTTDWELELDQEANKNKEYTIQFIQRNKYNTEETKLESDNNFDNQEDLNSIIEEVADDSSRQSNPTFHELDYYEECIETTGDLDSRNIDVEYLDEQE